MTQLTIQYRGENFRLAVRNDLAVDGVAPWCVRVGNAWYAVAVADSKRDPTEVAMRFLSEKLHRDPNKRGPAWLADRRNHLVFILDGLVVHARTRRSRIYHGVEWIFEYGGIAGEGGTAHPDDTMEAVQYLARRWLAELGAFEGTGSMERRQNETGLQ